MERERCTDGLGQRGGDDGSAWDNGAHTIIRLPGSCHRLNTGGVRPDNRSVWPWKQMVVVEEPVISPRLVNFFIFLNSKEENM